MSTKVDYDVTDNLRVRIDVNGEEFNEPETIAELSGHTFPDGHYYERLTIAHAEKMIEVLKRGIESRHPPTVESIRAARDALTAELKRLREAGYVEWIGNEVDYRPGRHGRL